VAYGNPRNSGIINNATTDLLVCLFVVVVVVVVVVLGLFGICAYFCGLFEK
jgi:heme/copper-type cytochrome/quinol oxidase subunit 2